MKINESTNVKGEVEATIQYNDGREDEKICFKNTILRTGRYALASSLANDYGDDYDYFIARMIFGDNGTTADVPKFVNTERNGLFGVTVLSKPVSAAIDSNNPARVTFTSVISFSEANGHALSEMALRMNTGDLYSMVTFPDLTKTETMQVTWVWSISFV